MNLGSRLSSHLVAAAAAAAALVSVAPEADAGMGQRDTHPAHEGRIVLPDQVKRAGLDLGIVAHAQRCAAARDT